jgi:hypothetical protein
MTRRLALSTLLLASVSCSGAAQAPERERTVPARNVAFVSQCSFANGVKIILIYRFGQQGYHFVIRRNGASELSTITPINDRDLDIDTNGGIGKMMGVGTLFRWLLGKSFRGVGAGQLEAEMARSDVVQCPGDYPFSPP